MATQSEDKKRCSFGDESQEKLAIGMAKGAEVVGSSLGPGGSNTLIERKFRTPQIINDGFTTINNFILEDELENLGVTSLVDAAQKASEHVGDGTSTTIVLTEAIYREGRKLVGGGLSLGKTPLEIQQVIKEEKNFVLKELKELSTEIKEKEDIYKVAIAAYANEEMADIVSDMIYEVGENGIVIVEEGWGRETETELTEGFTFAGKLAHAIFSNAPDAGIKLERVPILVTDFDFSNLNDLIGIVTEVSQKGEEGLIIIANRYERAAIEQTIKSNIFNVQNKINFKVHLIKTPSFTTDEFEEFAVFLGARCISKERKDKIVEVDYKDLGTASVFQISQIGDGLVIGGGGEQEAIDEKIEWLKEKLKAEKVKLIKARLEHRIAALNASIGIIKVASPSEGETEYIRLKTRNAVKSCQAAMVEGVVAGGGQALKEISEKLPEGILKEALKVPYDMIQRNAGGIEVKDVYDATKVIRTAVEQACSQAYLLINTRTLIALLSQKDFYDSAKMVVEKIKDK